MTVRVCPSPSGRGWGACHSEAGLRGSRDYRSGSGYAGVTHTGKRLINARSDNSVPGYGPNRWKRMFDNKTRERAAVGINGPLVFADAETPEYIIVIY